MTALDWLTVIKQEKEAGWHRFYKTYTGQPISQPKRFFDAVERLGEGIVFASVVSASFRTLDGDPLNYILAIAMSKFTEEVGEIDTAARYQFSLDKSKQRVEAQNEELEAKFEKAREISRGKSK